MLKWIQGGISSVTGIAEPEYGKGCIHSATERVSDKQPFRQTTTKDMEWQNPSSTNVETATFYFTKEDEGIIGFFQIINSKISGINKVCQFTFRLHHQKNPELNIWSSTKLENVRIEGNNLYADRLSMEINNHGTEYHLRSSVTKDITIDVVLQRLIPGVKVGEDPITYYGKSIKDYWGTVRHVFWPRNAVSGTIITNNGSISFSQDLCMFVMALQGMKPNHCARLWNFLNLQNATHSAILMEFITPNSYENTRISIGIVCDQNSVLAVTVDNKVEHISPVTDSVGWPVPKKLNIHLRGILSEVPDEKAKHSEKHTFQIEAPLNNLVERVDVMAEVPKFVKKIVSGIAGIKPYIYQYANELTLNYNHITSKGLGWAEVSFISEFEKPS